MTKKKIPYGAPIPVYFTEKELELIREHAFFNEEFGKMALYENGKKRLDLSLDDIEELHGFIAAEANHTQNKKLQNALDRILVKLDRYFDRYDDQHDLP